MQHHPDGAAAAVNEVLSRIFGITYALRLANLADTRFWRIETAAD